MNWKPEDWTKEFVYEQAHIALRDCDEQLEDSHSACFKAGAAAVLEVLKEKGVYLTAEMADRLSTDILTKLYPNVLKAIEISNQPAKAGWLVKIPDEEG